MSWQVLDYLLQILESSCLTCYQKLTAPKILELIILEPSCLTQ